MVFGGEAFHSHAVCEGKGLLLGSAGADQAILELHRGMRPSGLQQQQQREDRDMVACVVIDAVLAAVALWG